MSNSKIPVQGLSRRTFVGAASAAIAAPAVRAQAMPGRGKSVRPLRAPWDTFWYATMIVSTGLEKLGYEILPPQSLAAPAIYQALSQGDGHFTVDIVLPAATAHVEKYKDGIRLLDKPIMYPGSIQGYLIDKASSEKHGIKYMSDLRDPAKAKVFSDGRGDQAMMVGGNVGWGMDGQARENIKRLGLTETVKLVQGEYNLLAADVVARFKAGKPVLLHGWFPNTATIQLRPGRDLVWLAFKPGEAGPGASPTPNAIGCAAPAADNSCETGDGPTQYFAAVNKKWGAENPAATSFLTQFSMKIGDRVEQNTRMMSGEKSESDLRQHAADWIKRNQAQFDGWIDTARKA